MKSTYRTAEEQRNLNSVEGCFSLHCQLGIQEIRRQHKRLWFKATRNCRYYSGRGLTVLRQRRAGLIGRDCATRINMETRSGEQDRKVPWHVSIGEPSCLDGSGRPCKRNQGRMRLHSRAVRNTFESPGKA